jgi:hypothetical protein
MARHGPFALFASLNDFRSFNLSVTYYLAHGVDLAISTKESADYTAVVTGEVAWEGGKTQIYISSLIPSIGA